MDEVDCKLSISFSFPFVCLLACLFASCLLVCFLVCLFASLLSCLLNCLCFLFVCLFVCLFVVFGSLPPPMHSEEAMRMELEQLRKRVAYLEHQLILKKQPQPLKFNVSDKIYLVKDL